MSDYYDRQGQPISCDQARNLKQNLPYRNVALTTLPDGSYVATDWMGMDWRHQDRDPGLPLIFETMVYGGRLDLQAERYTTEAEARAGHVRWVNAAEHARIETAAERLVDECDGINGNPWEDPGFRHAINELSAALNRQPVGEDVF